MVNLVSILKISYIPLILFDCYQYPLVTHDPNMLKKVTGELTRKIKSISSRRKIAKYLVETVHTVPGCVQIILEQVS